MRDTLDTSVDTQVEDIRASVEYLRSKGKRVIAVVGHSKGAIESILYAAKYDDVDTVVSISARYNMMHGISGAFGETDCLNCVWVFD